MLRTHRPPTRVVDRAPATRVRVAEPVGSGNRRAFTRDLWLTALGLVVTVAAGGLAVADILSVLVARAQAGRWSPALAQALFLLIVAYMIYGACVYLLARLGYLRRLAAHAPATAEALDLVHGEPDPPLVTILVPSYKEDERVVRRTLLSAALQRHPRRRIVLLVDDPPFPREPQDIAGLEAARRLPGEIESLLGTPRRWCALALAAFLQRGARGIVDRDRESLALAALCRDLAAWLDAQADRYPVLDHADALLVETTFRAPAREWFEASERVGATGVAADRDRVDFESTYRGLLARFDVEMTSFERKRYDNLSHEPNKAMNLNSYIGLIGGTFREVEDGTRRLLERACDGRIDLRVPPSEFVLVVDADSVLLPDYALRLIHLMRQPGNERIAIAQTPYSAFPGAPGTLERVAGATTDIQYLIHQGFTAHGATFWVGANAVIRTSALADIATRTAERGHEITRFVQDRTLIEDTESTIDLLVRGWRLHNYPERLAYSETPPDFGSLLIQRRRWANGGLIILPKLLRHLLGRGPGPGRWALGLLMNHYLSSLAATNIGLLIVLGFSFEDSMRTLWLPLTAVPYYLLYTRDLRLLGYRSADVLRVYALNLVLIPVNLVGVLGSVWQALTGSKAAFGRTPKLLGRTPVPAIYLVAQAGIGLQWLLRVASDLLQHRPLHATLASANLAFLAYGTAVLVAAPDLANHVERGARWMLDRARRMVGSRAGIPHANAAR
jgi:cellulose synthase/poly-beta-1,6-N-acetylglucosamine synthase-like glycosyltransferase